MRAWCVECSEFLFNQSQLIWHNGEHGLIIYREMTNRKLALTESVMPMKDKYQGMVIDGHKWTGFADGLHMFEKRLPYSECRYGFSSILCTTEDIETGNVIWMIENGYTRQAKK